MSDINSHRNEIFDNTTENAAGNTEVALQSNGCATITDSSGVKPSKMIKSAVTFKREQEVWLGQLLLNILQNNGVKIDRGTILRAIIDAMIESKIDFAKISSEVELKQLVLDKLLER